MKLLIETFNKEDKLNYSRETTQSEPDWKSMIKDAKKYKWETKVKRKDGKIVRYEEIYKYEVLGSIRYVITVLQP